MVGSYYGDFPFLEHGDGQSALDELLENSTHTTLFHREIPIGTFGMVKIWPGVADGWFLPHAGLPAHAKQMLRTAREFIFVSCTENKIRRLQTAIDFNRAKALRFAMALDMKPEATLKCYGTQGQDYLLLARIFRS